MRPLQVLVVDDEPLARERLGRLLREADCEVVAELGDGLALLDWMAAHPPVDALFVDIQMPGPNGLEILSELKDPPPVVFVTAYSEYAIQAFEASALDYLRKPVYGDRLAKSLERIRARLVPRYTAEEWGRMIPPLQRIVIPAGDGKILMELKHVTHFELVGPRIVAHAKGTRLITHWLSLREVEEAFPEVGLMRIQRNILLRPEAVVGCRPCLGGRCRVMVGGGAELTVSRTMTRLLRARLGLD